MGVGQIKIKDHLSPAEAEIGAELGNFNLNFGRGFGEMPQEILEKDRESNWVESDEVLAGKQRLNGNFEINC